MLEDLLVLFSEGLWVSMLFLTGIMLVSLCVYAIGWFVGALLDDPRQVIWGILKLLLFIVLMVVVGYFAGEYP